MNYIRQILNNRKIVLVVGIIVLLIIGLLIDFTIDNCINNEKMIIDSMNDINTNKESDINNNSNDETNKDVDKNLSSDLNSNEENSDSNLEDSSESSLNDETSIESEDSNNSEDSIFVYVTGEVNVQGVVVLRKGSRISDAIDAAGGITGNANISKINLVFILEDGMKVNIPSDNDLKNNPEFEYITMGSGDGTINSNFSTNIGSNTGTDNSTSLQNKYSNGINVVNINTASQTELETLPGIGPSLALRIIKYRDENGKFSNIDEIKNVSGIGDSRFNDIKDYIVV